MIEVIISGGQTGVDRAALDAAIKMNIKHRGWCPRGRKAEDGTIPKKYNLKETDTEDYNERTKLNIRDSDGTLIFVPSIPVKVTDGTTLTIEEVSAKNKPHMLIDLSSYDDLDKKIKTWIKQNNIRILNIAGPRESQSPGIYQHVLILLLNLFQAFSK